MLFLYKKHSCISSHLTSPSSNECFMPLYLTFRYFPFPPHANLSLLKEFSHYYPSPLSAKMAGTCIVTSGHPNCSVTALAFKIS